MGAVHGISGKQLHYDRIRDNCSTNRAKRTRPRHKCIMVRVWPYTTVLTQFALLLTHALAARSLDSVSVGASLKGLVLSCHLHPSVPFPCKTHFRPYYIHDPHIMISYRFVFALLPAVAHAQYTLVKDYSGSSFFNNWIFYGNCESICVDIDGGHDPLCLQLTTSRMAMPCTQLPLSLSFLTLTHDTAL